MFKIGDIVKGIVGNDYLISDAKMTKGEVIKLIPENNEMEIKVLEHKSKSFIGNTYIVKNSREQFDYYFSKNDLQNGDIVYLRNGNIKFYTTDDGFYEYENCDEFDDVDNLTDLNDDLTHIKEDKYDIIKVVRPKEYDELFKREGVNPKEMTLKEVCDILGYEIKIKKED